VAAGFAALLAHTMLYAAFLEDPMAWTLLAIGTALAFAPAPAAEVRVRDERERTPAEPAPAPA
jgi:putative inorganic carbon (hco3(-)) transporter